MLMIERMRARGGARRTRLGAMPLVIGLWLAAQDPRPAGPARVGQLDPVTTVVGEVLVDTDGDGRRELVLVFADGDVQRFGLAPLGAPGLLSSGVLRLRDPGHSLLAFADLAASPGEELIVADGAGVAALPWPAAGGAQPGPILLSRRARCTLRTDHPQLRPFVQDLDGDGRPDLLLPTLQGVVPFLQQPAAADGALQFRALPLVPVPLVTEVDDGGPGLHAERQGRITVPQIETADLNGDGRKDLLTREGQRHAFHLQGGEAGFLPPIEVDLAQFQDSTPKAALAPGATMVLGDTQQLQRGFVDGDRIPDFVIAHRRKVWTFLGGKDGPQFTKARTQAVADDVSGMLLVDLDFDGLADLLTFQVQVPGIGTLLLGMVQSIDIDIRAVGYRSEAGVFASTPAWRRTLTLRIPPLLSLLSRQEEIVQRFTDIVGSARLSVRGAFTAAAAKELLVVRADGAALELFPAADEPGDLASVAGRRKMRDLLFEDPDPVFDLERVFELVSGLVSQQQAAVGSGAPLGAVPLRDPASWRPLRLLPADLDGAAGSEVVVVYQAVDDERRRAYDVLRFGASPR